MPPAKTKEGLGQSSHGCQAQALGQPRAEMVLHLQRPLEEYCCFTEWLEGAGTSDGLKPSAEVPTKLEDLAAVRACKGQGAGTAIGCVRLFAGPARAAAVQTTAGGKAEAAQKGAAEELQTHAAKKATTNANAAPKAPSWKSLGLPSCVSNGSSIGSSIVVGQSVRPLESIASALEQAAVEAQCPAEGAEE